MNDRIGQRDELRVGEEILVDCVFLSLPCFLRNSLFGVLVEDYASIDLIGRLSRALSVQAAAVVTGGMSFSLEGSYRNAARYSSKDLGP